MAQEIINALKVIVLTRHTREYLELYDPQALKQATEALSTDDPAFAAKVAEAREYDSEAPGYEAHRRRTDELLRRTTPEPINTELLGILRALTDWAREHTSPTDPNSPHEILIHAVEAIDKADKELVREEQGRKLAEAATEPDPATLKVVQAALRDRRYKANR
jgi:hypothetical protein